MPEPIYQALAASQIVRDYQTALEDLAGISVKLISIDPAAQGEPPPGAPPQTGAHPARNLGVAKLYRDGKAGGQAASRFRKSAANLEVAVVPVFVDGKLVATLLAEGATGEGTRKVEFSRLVRMVLDYGINIDLLDLREACLRAKVIPEKQFASVLRLLTIFAQHLAEFGNRWLLEQQSRDPLSVARAKEFVQTHSAAQITLQQAAERVHLSAGHFCSTFKKYTGITFTQYVSRVRVEKAKTLLGDGGLRITDVAFAAGFESIPDFNRVFKRYTGMSPTRFRGTLRN